MAKLITIATQADLADLAASLAQLPTALYFSRHWSPRRSIYILSIPMAPPARRQDVTPARYHPMVKIVIDRSCDPRLADAAWQLAKSASRVIDTDIRSLDRRMRSRGQDLPAPLREQVRAAIAEGGLPNRSNFLKRRRPAVSARFSKPTRPQLLDDRKTGFA